MAPKSNLSAVLRKVDDLCLVRIRYDVCCIYSDGFILCVPFCNNVYLFHRRNALYQSLARAVGINEFLVIFCTWIPVKNRIYWFLLSRSKVCIFEIWNDAGQNALLLGLYVCEYTTVEYA